VVALLAGLVRVWLVVELVGSDPRVSGAVVAAVTPPVVLAVPDAGPEVEAAP
jgi:hypothetical protein